MIRSRSDFEEATAFELFALNELCPVIEQPQGASIDLRGGKLIAGVLVKISISENLSQGAIDATRDKLAPLLFGAAWKVLDLAIELSFNSAGAQPKRGVWSIAEKVQLARSGVCLPSMLGCSAPVWNALMQIYVATTEHRHCLVHRTAQVDPTTGNLVGIDRDGNQLRPLTREQLLAISRAASLVCRGVVSPPIQSRSEDHLKYFLDQVVSHTGVEAFGTPGPDAPAALEIDVQASEGIVQLDIDAALAKARSVFTTVTHFNLIAYLGDGRELRGRVEDIPPGNNNLQLSALPPWITLVQCE